MTEPLTPAPSVTYSPAVIWLNYGDIDRDCTHAECYRDGEVTWCQENVFDTDVKYVRADLAASHSQAPAEPLSDGQIIELSAYWQKDQNWYEFERNDFLSAVRAILAEAAVRAQAPAEPLRDDLLLLLCSVADNLGDMPVSDEWAEKTARRTTSILDLYWPTAVRAQPPAASPPPAHSVGAGELPPLPAGVSSYWVHSEGSHFPSYSADQMRAYASATLTGTVAAASPASRLEKMDALLHAMQADAVRYLVPDNDCGADWFVSRMLWHLDGPTQREAQSGAASTGGAT